MPTTSAFRPEALLEALLDSPLSVAVIDRELRYTHVNAALAHLIECEPSALIGRTVREAAPQLADQLEPALRHVLETGEAIHDLEVHGSGRNAGRVWCEHLAAVKNGDSEVSGVIVTALEITPLRREAANLRSLFEHTSQGYCVFEVLYRGSEAVDARFLEANAAFERHSGLQGVVGRTLSQVVPSLEAEYVQTYAWVAETGRPMHFERGTLALGRVFEVEIVRVGDPEQRRVALLFTDVTARREAQETLRLANERNSFQLCLSDALRPVNDPFEVQRVAARLLQVRLNADRVYYAEVEQDAQHVTIAFDEGVLEPKVVGRHHMDSFGPTLMNDVRAGRTLLVEDAATDARLEPQEREAHLALGVRATLAYPLLKAGRLVALLVAQSGSCRQWTAEETLLVADTAERTWEALERARSAAALESSANRQAFLLRLNDVLRGLDSAEEIQLSAARLLGEHLGASSAGYAQDLGDGENVEITSDYSVPGVASLRGRYCYEDYGSVLLREFREGRTVVRPDIANDPYLSTEERDAHARIGIGASLNVPMLKNGRLVAVFFVNHPFAHSWTFEEVTLAAQTAERTWEAAQRARAEAALRASNEQFTQTIEDAPVPILLQAEDGEVLRINRAWTELTGYTHDDLPTLDAWLTHAHGQGAEVLRDCMRVLFSGETGIVECEFEIVTRTLERRTWLLSASSPGRLIDNRRFAVVMATDITERKASEIRLQRNAETFTHLVQTAPFGIYVIDANFRFAHMSAGALPSFNSVSPLLGRDFTEVTYAIWTEPFASEIISRFRHTLQTGESYIAASTEQRSDVAAVESYDWRIDRVTLPDGRYGVVCYFHDVTAPRAITRRLEEINAAQKQFVSDAAHELRAPLTSIRGNLSLLRRYPEIGDEERTEMLGDAEREATRLTRLIADLLAVARGEAREEIELERVALEQSLEAAWRTARSLSERRRFDLGTLKPMVVLGDPDALAQLFLILLENAVKYSPEDGAVRLETIERDGWAEVRVYNDGAGISSDELERVFERFYRTDRARSRTGGAMGTGLGLTIARQIVERHGGRVWLESEGGRGTTAVVRLPRQASDSTH